MTTYYVSSNSGNDGSNGTSQSSPLATLQQAANQAQAGDTVEVMNGTYTNAGYGQDVLAIRHTGYAGAPITFEAMDGQHPVIQFTDASNGISLWGASYINIRGFDIEGGAQNISQDYASSQESNTGNPLTNAAGIVVQGSTSSPPNHIDIENNNIANNPGSGIAADEADYVTIKNNTVYGNAHWSPWGASGISVSHAQSADGNTGTKDFVVGNTVHDNAQYVPNLPLGYISDGSGILIDDNKNTQTNNQWYNGGTEVSGNLSYNNGGLGIDVYDSVNVAVTDNNAYGNGSVLHEGDIGIAYSDNSYASNNSNGSAGASFASSGPAGGSSASSQSSSQSSGDSSGNQSLVVNVSADVWGTSPQFAVSIDGNQAGTYSTSALHSQGQEDSFTISNLSAGQHDVAISFLNDAYGGSPDTDSNLYVDSLDYGGQHYGNDTAALYASGTVHFTVGNSQTA